MEVTDSFIFARAAGGAVRTLLVLDDESCPAELQACYPRGGSRFSIQLRRGGLVRVHDTVLMPNVSSLPPPRLSVCVFADEETFLSVRPCAVAVQEPAHLGANDRRRPDRTAAALPRQQRAHRTLLHLRGSFFLFLLRSSLTKRKAKAAGGGGRGHVRPPETTLVVAVVAVVVDVVDVDDGVAGAQTRTLCLCRVVSFCFAFLFCNPHHFLFCRHWVLQVCSVAGYEYERKLHPDDLALNVQLGWKTRPLMAPTSSSACDASTPQTSAAAAAAAAAGGVAFVLRRNPDNSAALARRRVRLLFCPSCT